MDQVSLWHIDFREKIVQIGQITDKSRTANRIKSLIYCVTFFSDLDCSHIFIVTITVGFGNYVQFEMPSAKRIFDKPPQRENFDANQKLNAKPVRIHSKVCLIHVTVQTFEFVGS